MQVNGKVPNKFKIGEISISIDTKNPKRITFSSVGNIGSDTRRLHQKYPYTVTIDEDDIYSEVDMIVRNNPEYKIGNGAEIYRENIDPEEKIRKFQSERELISVRRNLPTDLATIYETYDDYHKNYHAHIMWKTFDSYGDGIPVAKEIEEHCKYIYSLFIEAEKGTLGQTKSSESKTSNQDISSNNTAEPHLEECNNITANIKKNSINTFTENLKTNIDSKELKLKQFTKEIENNPSLLANLSNDRLDKLINYYEKITEEKQNKIEKLKILLNNEV